MDVVEKKGDLLEKGKYLIKDSSAFLDIWKYRNVLWMLMKQQFAVFYNRAVFGIAWMVLNPLIYLLILAGVFFRVAGVRPSNEIPFILAAFTGLIIWNLFSHFVTQSATLLRSFNGLMCKIYFPRIYILYSQSLNLFLEYLTGCIILLLIMAILQFPFHWTLFWLLPIFFYSVFAFSGAMLVTSILSYHYKDFQFLVPFLIQLGFYISPIWFSASSIKDPFLFFFYHCNPVVGAIILLRSAVLGQWLPNYDYGFEVSCISATILFVIGMWYWMRRRDFLADVGM